MPAVLSFPGVYIEEVPSGVRTITGVATSITAFVGRALRGPVDTDVAAPCASSATPTTNASSAGCGWTARCPSPSRTTSSTAAPTR